MSHRMQPVLLSSAMAVALPMTAVVPAQTYDPLLQERFKEQQQQQAAANKAAEVALAAAQAESAAAAAAAAAAQEEARAAKERADAATRQLLARQREDELEEERAVAKRKMREEEEEDNRVNEMIRAFACRPVRVRMRNMPDIAPSPPDLETPLPPGCRVYRRAIRPSIIGRTLPDIAQRAEAQGRDIQAGQTDGKRKQVSLEASEDIPWALLEVLKQRGELKGRKHSEFNALFSLPGCKQQKLHWDYNPDLCEGIRRKPCSVILALEDGARLIVRDEVKGSRVPVVLSVGDVLVFDGDVAHAGAAYCAQNTRVHVYLDVPGVPRERDFTWFPRV